MTAATRVLVVDDNLDLADGLSWILGAGGLEVETAYTAEKALGKIEAGAVFDVVVLDWPQGGSRMDRLSRRPLGERSSWGKPTVLIGSAGLNLSATWDLRGGFG